MKARIGFRSLAAWITFGAALAMTATATYAMGVDRARHFWTPATCALWIACLIFVIRDQVSARLDSIEAAIAQIAEDVESTKKRVADAHDRIDALIVSVDEYGDRRQIAGHLSSIRQPPVASTQRLVAGSTSNVRVFPGR